LGGGIPTALFSIELAWLTASSSGLAFGKRPASMPDCAGKCIGLFSYPLLIPDVMRPSPSRWPVWAFLRVLGWSESIPAPGHTTLAEVRRGITDQKSDRIVLPAGAVILYLSSPAGLLRRHWKPFTPDP